MRSAILEEDKSNGKIMNAGNQNNHNSFAFKRNHNFNENLNNLNNFQSNIRFIEPEARPKHLQPPQYNVSNENASSFFPTRRFYYE